MSGMHTAYNDPRIGTVILGRYRLVRYLAAGGMGSIYLARAEGAAGFVRPVVIKRSLRVGDESAGRMFAREARILSQLRHPGIVSIHDFAEDGGDYVMVLDYVHGYTLSDWAKYLRRSQRALPVALAVHAMLRVLEALQYAHTMRDPSGELLGVVHRDVKPSNVLVDVQGDVKLADFGIARTDAEVTEVSVSDTTLKGTFPYMAPELFARAKPSPSTDVYSAAVTLYAILSGSNPFSSSDVAMTVGRVLHHEPEPLHLLRPDVPEAAGWAIANGMSKMAELRYASADAFAAALRASGVVDGDLEARFRTAVAGDFSDGAFAELLGVSSLAERAEAWSRQAAPGEKGLLLPLPAPDPTMQVSRPPTLSDLEDSRRAASQSEHGARDPRDSHDSHDMATALASPSAMHRGVGDEMTVADADLPAMAMTEAPRRRSVIPVVAIAIAAGLGSIAAIGWYVVARARTAPEPTVVVVRGDVSMEGSAASVPAPAPAPVRTASADAGVAARAVDKRPAIAAAPTTASDKDLTLAVRRRQKLITTCFSQHAAGVTGAPELSFRFHVERSGRVGQVELVPEALAGTPLGRCLLDVARGTQFGALVAPVTFRIPITVRHQ